MTKQEYEKIRQEVAKRYKDRISDLERKNRLLSEEFSKVSEENKKLKREAAHYKAKYNELPEYVKNLIDLADVFSRI